MRAGKWLTSACEPMNEVAVASNFVSAYRVTMSALLLQTSGADALSGNLHFCFSDNEIRCRMRIRGQEIEHPAGRFAAFVNCIVGWGGGWLAWN
jgi:hypothetical protein